MQREDAIGSPAINLFEENDAGKSQAASWFSFVVMKLVVLLTNFFLLPLVDTEGPLRIGVRGLNRTPNFGFPQKGWVNLSLGPASPTPWQKCFEDLQAKDSRVYVVIVLVIVAPRFVGNPPQTTTSSGIQVRGCQSDTSVVWWVMIRVLVEI